MQKKLMKFSPVNGEPRPYPSYAEQWREYHGGMAWLINPWTGEVRDASDIGSDVFGELIKEEDTTKDTVGDNVRHVVCAACVYDDILILGARHWDKTMHQQYDMMYNSDKWKEHSSVPSRSLFEQGFIDQHGVFMDRKVAMKVAIVGGQPVDIERGCGGDSKTLYSEGLY